MDKYKPEGTAKKQKEYEGLEGLKKAKRDGAILEGRVLMCDPLFNLTVDFGGITGTIKREDALYEPNREKAKDIAILTRVGKNVCFKVLEIDGHDMFFSRKQAQEECEKNYISCLLPGEIIQAKVTHLEHFGAFVDIGCGRVSLIAIDNISISRISHPSERFIPGQEISAVVKGFEDGKVILTHKELLGTWEQNAAKFQAGQTVTGIVRSIEEYGVFVELTPNLAGLAELRQGIKIGDCASVYIKSIQAEKMKIKLVIVDTFKGEEVTPTYEYYIKEGRISHFRYSPIFCEKGIETHFGYA